MTVSTLLALTPQLIVATGTVFALLLIAWQRSQQLIALFSVGVLVLALVATLLSFANTPVAVTPLVSVDDISRYAFVLVCLIGLWVIYLSHLMLNSSTEVHDEYYVLLLLVILGAGILVVSDHYASLFLGFELMSLSLVGLVGYLRNNKFAVETGFKYLILSATASSFMLLGIAFIYAYSGSLSFSSTDIPVISVLTHSAQTDSGLLATALSGSTLTGSVLINSQLHQLGGILFVCGMAFKLSLVPFHLWTADVYQGAPTPVTLLLATVSKLAVFMVLLKCFFSTPAWQTVQGSSQHGISLQGIIVFIAILSMLIGNILALKQQSLKRILGYSSIAHMGYLLVVLAIGRADTVVFARQTVLFYLTAYIIATTSIFTVITLYESNNQQVDDVVIKDWQGLFWQQPLLALLAVTGILGLAGIPLTAGFIGKFYLFTVATQNQLWWLLSSLIIGSSIALAYYLPIVFHVFAQHKDKHFSGASLTECLDSQATNHSVLKGQCGYRYNKVLVLLLILIGISLGIFPDTLSGFLNQLLL